MAERWEDTYFLSLKESADIKVHVHLTGEKVTLYSSDSNVVGVDFHDPSPWHLRTTWTCAPDPDKNYLHLSNTELWTQLCALKDKVDTGHGHLMTMNGHLVFVFGHDTDNDAGLMVAEKANINKVLLAFLKKIDNEVKDIKLTCTVDWDATQVTGKDSSTEITDKSKEQEESFVTRTQSEQELSEGTFSFTGMTGRSKADKSLVAGSIRAEAINQFEGKTLIVFNDKSTAGPYVTTWNFNFFSNNHFLEISPDSWRCLRKNLTESFICEILKAVRGSLILYFAHPTKDDAIDMIIKHKKVKHIIIQCLRELDIKDSSIQVELRELSESEVQTAQTSGKTPRE
ncbi:uncharacterized protein LOC124266494 [Haliotis rubra]|uniref:uncharacterized protein LOC124266494 n=1 Tax=Haliotis rubra TaxID=36100 RepID=UPI001EE4FA8A|nr:uncharacterized protein LOC124266494 [Haliotis rubra]